jgi:predicted amidophosphoribosyltransferase
MLEILGVLCVSAVIGGLIAYLLNGRVGAGLLWGFLLGPLGWLIVFFLEDRRKRCPACRSIVDALATVCPRCKAKQFPKPSTEEEPFCMKCGVEGLQSTEMGITTAVCPQCGQKL